MKKHVAATTSPTEMPITSTVMTAQPYPATTFTEETISYEFFFFLSLIFITFILNGGGYMHVVKNSNVIIKYA